MPVDLAKDARRLLELVQGVPGLGEVCALALAIIKSAQHSGCNKLRLHSLAHFTADHIVNVAKCIMHGRSSSYNEFSARLLEVINDLKCVLHDVSYAIYKYSNLSLEAFQRSAPERDKDITKLEERLLEVQTSIFSLYWRNDILTGVGFPQTNDVNFQIGITVHRPQTAANTNYHSHSGQSIKRPETTTAHRSELSSLLRKSPLQRNTDFRRSPCSQLAFDEDAILFLNSSPQVPSVDRTLDVSNNFTPTKIHRVSSPVDRPPSRNLFSRLRRKAAPNLTEDISDIQDTRIAGGYSEMYSGILTTSRGSERVALKLLRVVNKKCNIEKVKKSFRREVGIWCLLRHQNVLPFYGICEHDDDHLFMVSPWAEGGNLLEYLQRNPHVHRGQMLQQTSCALDYLHSANIVHGDVKGANVLVSRTGQALLCDFGISRNAEGYISGSYSNPKGTGRFMAPELLISRENMPASSKPTKESDVYAFASLMLQTYTERVPYSDLVEPAALMKIANSELPLRPTEPIVFHRGLNDHVWGLMLECWKTLPSQRPKMKDITWQLLWAIAR